MPPYIAPEANAIVGFWGRATSTLDWCEENYITSFYIAEFWNTISNLAMIIPPLFGLYCCQRSRLETRYTLSYLGLLAVGIGSWLFHGTLLYEMQLLDEIPMLICCVHLLYSLFFYVIPFPILSEMGGKENQTSPWGMTVAVTSSLYVVIVTIVYMFVHDPTFHEIAYGLMVIALTISGFYSVWKYDRCRSLTWAGLSFGIYAFGFVLWSIDNHFCPTLRELRQSGFQVAFLTQLHAWWHLCAGLATYLHIVLSSLMRMNVLGYKTEVKSCLGLPYFVVHSKKHDS